jgi:hypothetical protein
MKKDSILKMLKIFKAAESAENITIINLILTGKTLEGIVKTKITKTSSKKILGSLNALNKKGVVMEITVKGVTRVNLTPKAWIELLGAEAGKKTAKLLSESEKALKDVTAFAKKQGGKLKKKAAKKTAKLLNSLADKLRKKAKK